MATTKVDSLRSPLQALEKYPDAVFVIDDKKLYFGTDGDTSFEYDEDGNNVVLSAGADIRLSSTQQLQFGDSGDATLTWNGSAFAITGAETHSGAITFTGGITDISGGDVRLSDSVQLIFGSTSGSDVEVYYKDKASSDGLVMVGLNTGRKAFAGLVFVSDGFLKIEA